MSLADRLDSTGAVTRKSRTTNNVGGFTVTATTQVTSVACRVALSGTVEVERGDKVISEGMYRIFVLSATATDAVKIHDTVTVSTIEYEIVSIRRPSRGNHLEWETVRIDSE